MNGAPGPEKLSSTYLSAQAGPIKVQWSSHHCHITAYPCVLNEFLIPLLQKEQGLLCGPCGTGHKRPEAFFKRVKGRLACSAGVTLVRHRSVRETYVVWILTLGPEK